MLKLAESGTQVDGQVFCVANKQRPKSFEVMKACLEAANYFGEVELAPATEEDLTSTWFDQNEFITSGKIRRLLN